MQYNLVILATLAMFIVEMVLIVPVLSANRQIYREDGEVGVGVFGYGQSHQIERPQLYNNADSR